MAVPTAEDSWTYSFEYFSTSELSWRLENKREAWFPVGGALHWKQPSEAIQAWQTLSRSLKREFTPKCKQTERALTILTKLYDLLNQDDLIRYHSIRGCNLAEAIKVLDIVELHQHKLENDELYFSQITAFWKEGRNEIKCFLKLMNRNRKQIKFELNTLMLVYLALSNEPIRITSESFRSTLIETLREKWPWLQEQFLKANLLLKKWNIPKHSITNKFAIIPTILAIKSGYCLNSSAKNLKQLILYLLNLASSSPGVTIEKDLFEQIKCFMELEAKTSKTFGYHKFLAIAKLP